MLYLMFTTRSMGFNPVNFSKLLVCVNMMYFFPQEYDNARNEFKHAKDSRKDAERRVRAIRQKYQPIKNKQKEQEEAVRKFKAAEQVRKL